MENKSNNFSDDFTFAMKLQEEEFRSRGLISEASGNRENEGNTVAAYEFSHVFENDDYVAAMRLQQMYDEKKSDFENGYEGVTSRMNNMTFEHRGEENYSNKDKSKKEVVEDENFSQKSANYLGGYDAPPPYISPHNPAYNYNNFQSNPIPQYKQQPSAFDQPNIYKQQQNPFNQPDIYRQQQNAFNQSDIHKQQPNAFDQPDIQSTLNEILNTLKSQQNNNNKPDHFARNNNQPDYFARDNKQSNNFTYDNDDDFSQKYTRNKFKPTAQGSHEFRILLLGGTGTGKSTIINTVTNYFLGGTLDEPKIVIPSKYYRVTEREFANEHSEAKFDDVTKSQTTKCYNYCFNHPENPAYKFIFIDTPGLSDTNGVKQDDKNIQEIIDAAISVGSLSAIVIIANGTEARVTPSIKNTLVRLANNLPDELVGNLLLILTKCAKSSACFSEEAFTREFARPKHIFYMDNQAFCTDPQIWKNDFEERTTVQFHWEKSIRTIDNLLEAITEMSSTSTQAFAKMKDYRDKIKSEIVKVTQDIANIQKVQDSLDAAQKALQISGDKKNSFANYTQTESIKLKKVVKVDYHSTVCTLHLKEKIICHEHCGLEFKGDSGTNHFGYCACMGPEKKCIQCGCGPLSHFHDKVKLIEESKTIKKVLEDMKAQYDSANQQHKKYSDDTSNYQSTISTLQTAANAKYEHIRNLCIDLSKICSRFNFVDELHANIESMKQDARTIQNTNVRKNAEAEIQRLEKLANDLSSSSSSYSSSSSSSHSPSKSSTGGGVDKVKGWFGAGKSFFGL